MEDLDNIFVSPPVLSTLKLLIVVSTAIRIGTFCFDIMTAFIRLPLSRGTSHLCMASR